jgi:hypothetical protein
VVASALAGGRAPLTAQSAVPRPTDIFITGLGYPDRRFDPAVLAKTHASIISIGLQSDLPFPDPEEQYLRRDLAQAHAAGLRYTGMLSIDDPFGPFSVYEKRPELLESVCIDIEGRRLWDPWENLWWHSTNHPLWRQQLLEVAKRSVDAGVDGIAIDGWTGNIDAYRQGGCFEQYSLAGFREYLRRKYTPEELKRLGVDDPDRFDFAAFIRQKYLAAFQAQRFSEIPLWNDLLDYEMRSVLGFLRELIAQIRSYAASRGRSIYITANMYQLYQNNLPIHAELDYLTVEYKFSPPPRGRTAPTHKLAWGLGKPALLFRETVPNTDLAQRPDLTSLMTLYTAEAYATRGFVEVPYATAHWTPEGWRQYSADLDQMRPLYDFIAGNKPYYEGLESVTPVALLYSYASARHFLGHHGDNFWGAANLLQDAHLQYDVLFAGDGQWTADTLDLEALRRYWVIILAGTRALSDRHVDLLLKYVEEGGWVLAHGVIGDHDELRRPVNRERLAPLLVEGSQWYGLGRFVYTKEDLGAKYLGLQDAAVRRQLAALVEECAPPRVRTDASENVGALEYWSRSQRAMVVHLVNYNYDPEAMRLSSQTGIKFDVGLMEPLLGREVEVFYGCPGCGEPRRLPFTATDGRVAFQVPLLEWYGVISIKPKP